MTAFGRILSRVVSTGRALVTGDGALRPGYTEPPVWAVKAVRLPSAGGSMRGAEWHRWS